MLEPEKLRAYRDGTLTAEEFLEELRDALFDTRARSQQPFILPVDLVEEAKKMGFFSEDSETPDTWSSASRQHYIDTGRYLTVEETREMQDDE